MDRETERLLNERQQLRSQLDYMQNKLAELTRPRPAEERNQLAAAQSRADSVARLFGSTAPQPVPGETPLRYRQRLLGNFQKHSPKLAKADMARVDADALGAVEDIIYADAAAASRDPASFRPGEMRAVTERDPAGREITRWVGDGMAWRQHFMLGAAVGRIRQPSEAREIRP